MTELSPAALAVWEAFNQEKAGIFVDYKAGVFVDYSDKLAAALRAFADTKATEVSVEGHYRMIVDVDDIHAIADELEAQ